MNNNNNDNNNNHNNQDYCSNNTGKDLLEISNEFIT